MNKRLSVQDAASTSVIHFAALASDFLPSFGKSFLFHLHRLLITSTNTIAFGAYKNGSLVGFIIATTDTKKTVAEVYRRGFFLLWPYVVKKILVSPKTVKYLWQTWRWRPVAGSPTAEILVLAIHTAIRRRGLGTQLLTVLKKELTKLGFTDFKVGTLKKNTAANRFYRKHGGVLSRTYQLYDNIWHVYHYHI